MASAAQQVLVISRPESSKLRRELGRLDTVCMLIAAVVVIDTLGAVASGGAQALTWLVVVALTFFVPAGLVISELGAAFPEEGGSYVWTRLAFGRLCGALTAFLYWIESPIWLGGSLTITAVTVFGEFFAPLEGIWLYAFALGFIWTAIAVAIAPLSKGKRVPASGAAAQVLLLTFFTATVGIYALEHGVHGFGVGHFSPTWAAFVAVAPVLFYNLIGFELPSAAAGEMRNPQRDVPASIGRAGALTFVLYSVPIIAILAVLPAGRITSLTGFIDAMKSVFTVYGGHVSTDGAVVLSGGGQVLGGLAAAGFIWILLTNGLTWVMGTSRSQAVACLDGAGPHSLGRFSRRLGTPVLMCLVSGGVATTTMAAAFAISGGSGERYFSVVLSLSIVLLALSNLAVFPALVKLRRSHPDVVRPFRVPGGAAGAWLCSALATGWALFAILAALWPGLGTPNPDAALPDGFAGDRLGFVLAELVPLAALLAAALVFVCLGRRSKPAPEVA
jgi:amino acid transporter